VKTDDAALKSRINHVVVAMSSESAKEVQKLDEEVCSIISLRKSPRPSRLACRAVLRPTFGSVCRVGALMC
jgi:hypothetical protein